MQGEGYPMGRPRVLEPAQVQEVLELAAQPGHTLTAIAEMFGVSRRTISKILKGEAYTDVTGFTKNNQEGSTP